MFVDVWRRVHDSLDCFRNPDCYRSDTVHRFLHCRSILVASETFDSHQYQFDASQHKFTIELRSADLQYQCLIPRIKQTCRRSTRRRSLRTVFGSIADCWREDLIGNEHACSVNSSSFWFHVSRTKNSSVVKGATPFLSSFIFKLS